MVLVELPVDAADARAVFVRCTRTPDEEAKTTFLRLALVAGPRLWRCDVHEKHKPVVLDCSASAYLAALEAAFTVGGGGGSSDSASASRFSYKWSSDKATLTLMEHAGQGLAMKYASLVFERAENEHESWQELLHEIVFQSQHSYNETTRQRERIGELEAMLKKKDSMLETALNAKQRLEDELFTKFCAVLNAKKEELERLQRSLAIAQAKTNSATAYNAKTANGAKKRAAPTGRKKAVGAKLTTRKRKKKSSEEEEEEEEEDTDESDSVEEEAGEEDSGESEEENRGNRHASKKRPAARSRIKREAIEAYSQLASQLHTPSQARAAADVLEDLDAIMKTEVEQDEEQTLSQGSQTRKRSVPPSAALTRAPEKKSKVASTPTTEIPKAKPKPKPASPPRRPVDSEEEDILDMLS